MYMSAHINSHSSPIFIYGFIKSNPLFTPRIDTFLQVVLTLQCQSQVSAMIGNLRNMANDMNGELENQNSQLDRINLKAASDITRVKMANDKAAALLK